MKILVVDYPGASRRHTVAALSEAGYTEVVEADDARAAHAVLAAGGIDLVITEYHLTVMTGMVFVRDVRRDDPTTPILLLTRETLPTIFEAALDVGVNDTLSKPATPEALRAKIEALRARG